MMNNKRTHVLLTVLVAGILAACTASPQGGSPQTGKNGGVGQSGSLDPIAQIQAASNKVLQAGALHMRYRVTMSAGDQEITGAGQGDSSMHELKQHMSFHFDGMAGLPGGMRIEMILNDHMLYMRSPAFTLAQGVDTEWVSMDLNRLVPGFEDLAALGTGQNDPSSAFGYLEGVQDAEVVGTEQVGGVETTRYHGTLSLADAVHQLPRSMRHDYRKLMEKTRHQLGNLTMPFDVWIDADGLLRRMTFRMESDGGSASSIGAFSMEMTVDVTRYYDRIRLHLPPRSAVTDLSDLFPPS